MTTFRLASLALVASAFVAGCASDVPLTPTTAAPVESRTGAGTGAGSGASTGGAQQGRVASVDLTQGVSSAAEVGRVVYFDFDSYIIKDEYKPLVEGQAKALAGNRQKRVSIEGHTDERGGSEYNLALGQKRAESVARALTLLGVSESQVEAVSFGKERPAAQGSDESAWAKNRRAELNVR